MTYFRFCTVCSGTVPAFCEHVHANERSIIKRPHSYCQLLKIKAAVCRYLKIITVSSLRKFYVTSEKFQVSKTWGCQCWRGFPCSGIWLRRERHIRAVCCICPQNSRKSATNLKMEVVSYSETFKQFDRVLTDVTYRNVCVVACVTTARTAAATTATIMYNSFYFLCTGHISHDPFLRRIPFNVSFMISVHSVQRLSSQIIRGLHTVTTKRTLYSLESEISVWSQVCEVRHKQKLTGQLCWTFE
jgi:hypothetical protein